MIKEKKDITDEEFQKKWIPFYNNFYEYILEFIIPDTVAFYFANGYSRNRLSNCSLKNHINSAINIFNIVCDIDNLIHQTEKILKIKYNLKIINDNPLKIEKIL